MKKFKGYATLSVVAAVAVAGVFLGAPAEAGARIPSTVPQFGLVLNESFDLNLEGDAFYTNPDNPDSRKMLLCDGVDDPLCTEAATVMEIHNWPVCSIDSSFDCISSVWAIDPNGKKIDGVFQTMLPVGTKNDHDAIPSMLLSAGRGMGGLWKIPGVVNSGGTDSYFVSVRNNSWANKAAGTPLRYTQIYYGQMMAGIVPVQPLTGNYQAAVSGDARMPGRIGWGSNMIYNTPEGDRCTVTDANLCEAPRNFPEGYRFGMTVKAYQYMSGWFHGRISRPLIDISKSATGQLISIEAEPVKISTLDFLVPRSQVPESVAKVIFAERDWGVQGDPRVGIQTMLNGLDDPETMQIMTDFLPVIGDKATKTKQYWSYRALNAWRNPEVQKCSGNKSDLGGVVTTNALTYSAGPPTYNAETGALEYKVASPHFDASGAVALGTYDLAVKSDVARCIYGFSNAPIQATISIVSDSGEAKVATTVVNEKNGWLYLSAKGFTFSSPTIRVKLTQEAAPEVSPSPTPTPMGKAAAKTSITCVKGKVSKKVTAIKPKCPAGYKAR